MPGSSAPSRKSPLLPVLAVMVAASVVLGIAWFRTAPKIAVPPAMPSPAVQATGTPNATPVAEQPQPVPAPAAAAAPAPTSAAGGPRFDIARIAPNGNAVIAGRARPGAQVTVLDGTKPIGEAQADAHGAFVLTPAAPLPPGTRELHLSERAPDGTEAQGREQVLLVVPPRDAAAGQAPMALLTTPNEAPRLLQTPAQGTPAPGTPAPVVPDPIAGNRPGLDVVDYDARGNTRLSGTAPAGATLRLYVDNQPVGTARTDDTGHWSLSAPFRLPPGDHQLRLDQLVPAGQVAARVEIPFRREAVPAAAMAADGTAQGGQVVVRPGDNLWLLARQSYGEGLRYTAIFTANRAQIRDPDLIYPGQVLIMPATPAR